MNPLVAFATLRFGELAALRRRDIDVEGWTVTVRRAQAELQDGRLVDKAPQWTTSRLRDMTVMSSSGRREGSCGGATSGTTG